MSNVKMTMTELQKVVRMLLEEKSRREIERMTGLARTSILAYKERAEQSGMSQNELLELDDETLHYYCPLNEISSCSISLFNFSIWQ